jgi:2-oxoglutarate dehydrogenase complex dehydrogenase (E1) component-like enzyme
LLLRHSFTVSPFSQFAEGTTFKPVLLDPNCKEPNKVKKLIFCSGKHAVILLEEREKREGIAKEEIGIVRLEGICPFPVDDLSAAFKEYPNAQSGLNFYLVGHKILMFSHINGFCF